LAAKERARAVESPRPAPRPARVLAPERQPAIAAGPVRAPGAVPIQAQGNARVARLVRTAEQARDVDRKTSQPSPASATTLAGGGAAELAVAAPGVAAMAGSGQPALARPDVPGSPAGLAAPGLTGDRLAAVVPVPMAPRARVAAPRATETPPSPAARGGQPIAHPATATSDTGHGELAVPDARRAIAPAASAVHQRAHTAKRHPPAHAAVGAAQAAAIHPQTEQTRGAAVQTVTELAAAKPQDVRREEFKAKLKKAISDATQQPKTEAEANAVMKKGGKEASESLKADLGTERKAAVGPMEAAAAAEAPVSGQPVPPVTGLHVQPPGPAPARVSPDSIVPAPLPAERLDYSADREPTDRAMAQDDVTEDQLKKGNDPAFTPTLDSRATAEKHEVTAKAQYRGQERAVQGAAHAEAALALTQGLGGIHAGRIAHLEKVGGKQQDLKTRDALKRQDITNRIASIKDKTKTQVDAVLKQIDDEAPELFGSGLAQAEKAYDAAFEEAKGGIGTWLTTWGSRWERLITRALAKARAEYMLQVDIAIDKVADLIDKKLSEAKECVAAGRREVNQFVQGLDEHLRQAGKAARDAVSGDFDAMAAQIDEHRDALVSKLAQQYKESYERMSAREEELREANKSLWQRVYDATVGLIKKIIAFKNMLLDVLARAAGVVSEIIHDPIGFLGNLVSAVMLGLKNFMANIEAHLEQGLMDWIFGALAGAGLQLPKAFDLKGIISIVLQVLGLTYANFRARAVAIVGEQVVAGLEQAAGVFKIFMTEGVSGLWEFIKEKVSDLKSMVLDAIFSFVKEKVIIAGVTWIIGLLNPVSAFFKACKAIYDIITFFVEHASEILALVNAIIDSVSAIVKGNITAAAARVEDALAKAIPVAIGFLANLLGLGDPSKPVKETIDKAQAPVNKAIDWVITKAVALVKAVGKLVGFGKKKDEKKDAEHPIYDEVNQALDKELGQAAEVAHIRSAANTIFGRFQAKGLRKLDVEDDKEGGGVHIVAEASPGKELRAYRPRGRRVWMTATITTDTATSLAELQGTTRSHAVPGYSKPAEAELLDPVSSYNLPKGKRGGVITVSEGGKKIEAHTWNTGELDKLWADNPTHAERQFTHWLGQQSHQFLLSVTSIELKLGSPKKHDSPCKWCAIDLRGAAERVPNARALTLYYTGMYTPEGGTLQQAQKAVKDVGEKWKVYGPDDMTGAAEELELKKR
jgi:hypothetical protein